jgi:hypothetical protein
LLYPWLQNRIGYMGISFGGGIGALALPWEPRIALGHLNVPTFGHYPLRMGLRSIGSSESVRQFVERNSHTAVTLSEYDAAVAASFIRQPMHLALALFDPVVPPPGQFAIYNAIPGDKRLMVLRAGHFDYPEQTEDEQRLIAELAAFFSPLGTDRPARSIRPTARSMRAASSRARTTSQSMSSSTRSLVRSCGRSPRRTGIGPACGSSPATSTAPGSSATTTSSRSTRTWS